MPYFSHNFFSTSKNKPWTIVNGFGPKSENFDFAKSDANGKSISRGAEWHKFQLHSTFQWGVMKIYGKGRHYYMYMYVFIPSLPQAKMESERLLSAVAKNRANDAARRTNNSM